MSFISFIIILFLFYYLPKFGYRLAARRASRCQSQALMKRGGQLTLSLGGTMRLVPASRSLLAVPAATGQPDAGRWSRLPSAPRKFSIVR